MRRVLNSTYMTLDGVIQTIDWTFDYRDDAADKFAKDQLFSCDAVLMGRKTYETFAEVWPTEREATGMADHMNAVRKYVVSDSLSDPKWNNTTVISRAELPARVRELKQQPGQDLIQYGYGPVTTVLMREGLLDELRIWLHPLLVGGRASDTLLAQVDAEARFRLAEVKTYDSGLVILSFQPRPDA